jgi:hypothetical protein
MEGVLGMKLRGKFTSFDLGMVYDPATDLFRLQDGFWFIRPNGDAIPCPKGMITDLCSIPWYGQWLFPKSGPWNAAGVVHDILCQGEFLPIPVTNLIFKEALEALGISQWRVELMYKAVQIGTAPTYRKHTTATINRARMLCKQRNFLDRPLWPDGRAAFI